MRAYVERTEYTVPTRYVASVSWPRSGHHLLVRLCHLYLQKNMGYCIWYKSDIPCCRCFPCRKKKEITLSKNHDFHSKLRPDFSTPLLVQYRDFLPALVSDFELYVQSGHQDSPRVFRKYALLRAIDYNVFAQKWVNSPWPGERFLLKYEDLTAEPAHWLCKVLGFVAPDHSADSEMVEAAIANVNSVRVENKKTVVTKKFGVRKTRNIEDFRYFDARFFAELAALSSSRTARTSKLHRMLRRLDLAVSGSV